MPFIRKFPHVPQTSFCALFLEIKSSFSSKVISSREILTRYRNEFSSIFPLFKVAKESTLAFKDLEDFVTCYNPKNRHERKPTERFKAYTYNELMQRDKANLDIFWLKDESLEDTDNLPAPEVLAAEIAENLQSALEQFNSIIEELKENKTHAIEG